MIPWRTPVSSGQPELHPHNQISLGGQEGALCLKYPVPRPPLLSQGHKAVIMRRGVITRILPRAHLSLDNIRYSGPGAWQQNESQH